MKSLRFVTGKKDRKEPYDAEATFPAGGFSPFKVHEVLVNGKVPGTYTILGNVADDVKISMR